MADMTPGAVWKRVLLVAAAVAGTAAAVAVLVALFGPLADRATPRDKDRAAAVNATRQILLATTAGFAALVGLGFTARTFYLSRRGQLTDRYTKAISQLASTDKLTERLGGIYALEHLMRESGRDHETVVDVLAAFIREQAPISRPRESETSSGEVKQPVIEETTGATRPATDVQAALTVLSRRPRRPEANPVDLRYTDLRGAVIRGAQLEGAQLMGTRLQDADLTEADLQYANLTNAQLQDARLAGVNLRRATLTGAQFQNADLRAAQLHLTLLADAQLQHATLTAAQLQGAYLVRAQLQGADLTGAQLDGAYLVGAQLQGAYFGGGAGRSTEDRLVGRYLPGATLINARLAGANLTGAVLRDADLSGAEFCRPDGTSPAIGLTPDQIEGAILSQLTRTPEALPSAPSETPR